MRNCDARMTGEVHKRFHLRRRKLVGAPETSHSDSCPCGVYYHVFGNSADGASCSQQNASGSNSERVSRAPVITAKPDRLAISCNVTQSRRCWSPRLPPGGLHSGRKLNLLPGRPHQRAAEGTAQRPISSLVAAEQLGKKLTGYGSF